MWFPDGPVADQAAAGAALLVNVNASPVLRGRRDGASGDAGGAHRRNGAPSSTSTRSAARTNWSSTGRRSSSTPGATWWPAPASSTRRCWWPTSTSDAAAAGGRRDTDPSRWCRATTAASAPGDLPRPGPPWSTRRPRSTRRSSWAPVTTCRRTGSPTPSSGCRAGSTPRWWRRWPSTPGCDHVHGVSMPSRYSSDGLGTDAEALARLGIDLATVPIEPRTGRFTDMLAPARRRPGGLDRREPPAPHPGGAPHGLSNARGWIVLTTGNKSEMATGYSTLYGDSAGGFAVIKDVPKTLVYGLCRYRNTGAGTDLIPEAVLDKAPSAELRPDQRDDESCLLTTCSTRSWRTTSRATGRRPTSSPRASTPRWWPGWCDWSTGPSTSAARCRPGCGSRPRRSARTVGCPSPTGTGLAGAAGPPSARPRPRPCLSPPGPRRLTDTSPSTAVPGAPPRSHRRSGG